MSARVAIIGAGGIAARRMLPALVSSSDVEVRTVMDVDADTARDVATRFDVPSHVTQLSDAITDDVDAFYVASPVDVHAEQAIACLQAGRSVLLEKPMARTMTEAESIAAAARETSSRLHVAFMMRYHPLHQKARTLIAEEAIGRPVSARARLTCWYPDIPGAWRQDPARGGGGSLPDLAAHSIDLLTWMLGPVERVACLAGTLAFGYDVEDTSTLLAELTGGVQVTIEAHFSVPDGTATSCFEILGTRGTLLALDTLGQEARGELRLSTTDSKEYDAVQGAARQDAARSTAWTADGSTDLYAAELLDLLAPEPSDAASDAEQGLAVQRVLDAARRASESGHFEGCLG